MRAWEGIDMEYILSLQQQERRTMTKLFNTENTVTTRDVKHISVHVTGVDYASALADAEAAIYEAAYAAARYNQSKAAIYLGVSRGTFRTKLREHFGDKYISLAEHLYNGPDLEDN